MHQELQALERNNTWSLTHLPKGKKAIGCKWVYKVKLNPDGTVARHKARLVAKGFHQVQCVDFFDSFSPDHCLFVKASGDSFLAMLVYVDDVLVTGNSQQDIDSFKAYLDGLFTIKDLGCAKYFLGVEIARNRDGTYLNQRKYILDILHDTGLMGCKPATVPLPPGIKLIADSGIPLPDPEKYRRLVGRLLYLNFTRPDITYSVQQLSQFVTSPRSDHWEAALHLVKYLKGTPYLGLFYSATSSFDLTAFSDADWGSCPDTRKSLTGYCLFLGSSLISWKMKKQNTVSHSSAETEYRALGTTVCELQWVSFIAADLHICVSTPIPLWCDNKAALHIVENPVFHERTKHLDIDCHLVRNHFKSGFILLKHVSSTHQIADVFTKSLPSTQFRALLLKLGLIDHHCPT
ncbi:hypothetical protein DH2020_037438 [Rehmannia glutinosa]|uniref:Reverse transcriptase Ty1/copia-type domain-containing protein n=1 Tax=Rehmannia glutinosa TaxID=99300 RepID=A0ABR0V3V9_REHGL